jgi:hypothetical protein
MPVHVEKYQNKGNEVQEPKYLDDGTLRDHSHGSIHRAIGILLNSNNI